MWQKLLQTTYFTDEPRAPSSLGVRVIELLRNNGGSRIPEAALFGGSRNEGVSNRVVSAVVSFVLRPNRVLCARYDTDVQYTA